MIISHRYKFIYLRTEKTASSSLMQMLRSIVQDDEQLQGKVGWRLARRFPNQFGSLKRTHPNVFGLHSHTHASGVRKVVGANVFDSYFKFAVERNPWDRQVSLYHHREFRRNNQTPNFEKDMASAIYRNLHHTNLSNWKVYSIGEEVIADQVLDYASLGTQLPTLFERLGIETTAELQKTNATYSGSRPHYSTYYSDETRDLIGNWYKREIDAFGYKFEDKRPGSVGQR